MLKCTSHMSDHPRARAALAGLADVMIVCAAGFLRGAVRVVWGVPRYCACLVRSVSARLW